MTVSSHYNIRIKKKMFCAFFFFLSAIRCEEGMVHFIKVIKIITIDIEGLTLDSELKDGEILSLDLSDRKWGTANIAGNIALKIPQVIFLSFRIFDQTIK